jgi:hypothetical protein
MTKHKTEDYKISAVKYYLNNDKGDGYKKTCKIFDCKKSIEKAIDKVKTENYKNYFEYAYNLKEGYKLKRKASTIRRKSKIYK